MNKKKHISYIISIDKIISDFSRLRRMAIYRTRTHFDIDTSKYEHEYIINNYSKVFRYLHIETYVGMF